MRITCMMNSAVPPQITSAHLSKPPNPNDVLPVNQKANAQTIHAICPVTKVTSTRIVHGKSSQNLRTPDVHVNQSSTPTAERSANSSRTTYTVRLTRNTINHTKHVLTHAESTTQRLIPAMTRVSEDASNAPRRNLSEARKSERSSIEYRTIYITRSTTDDSDCLSSSSSSSDSDFP